jgi:D-xylose transport system substrate-binding protein
MTKRRNAFGAAIAAASIALTGFVAVPAHAATGFVGVVLPDSASSNRWEAADRPFLQKAFDAAGVQVKIANAGGSVSQFQSLADGFINGGAKVLIMVNLDSASAKAEQDKAKAQGIPTIDYDRLTLNGSESYYVSFDNTKVGVLQGTGIVNCLKANKVAHPRIVYLNGSPTDNNATLFAKGYKSVVGPYVKAKGGTVVADQSVPGWDNVQGGTIFEQMLTKAKGKLDAVVSANEGLGLAAVAVLKKNHLNGKVCVSGQDATDAGLAAILTGDLSNTVYKAIKAEANGAAALAVSLINGQTAQTNGVTNNGTTNVPSVLLTPVSITRANVETVVNDGFTTAAKICAIAGAAACTKYGVK